MKRFGLGTFLALLALGAGCAEEGFDTRGDAEIACRDGADCPAELPLCDPGSGSCVACMADADCSDPAASDCDPATLRCVPCATSDQCAHVAGATACLAGRCVECTADDESGCGGASCDPATHSCTDTPVGSRRTCEACIADSECPADHRCVPMEHQGEPRARAYCLKDADAGCERPFSIIIADRQSLSGASPDETYCGINEQVATCETVRALLDDVVCPGGANEECPQPGGLCRIVGALDNRCTYACNLNNECVDAPSAGSTCGPGTTGGVDYCGG